MATDTPQRVYRAPCPGCGAPVEFRSAQSTHAVCGYCQSTVVRDGETLSRIGKMAELFDDHSPMQLLASGTWNAQSFTLVGRLQYKYREGTWTEWHALLADGSSAWLSDDNGAYVFTLPLTTQRELPTPDRFRVGGTTAINGKTFSVASNEIVSLISAQGELPHLPALGQEFSVVDLRSADGEVLSVDYGPTLSGGQPSLSRGRSVLLEDLKLSGLRDEVAKEEKAQEFSCPNCGAAITVTLASSKSITCASCHSIIDLSQGVGAQLQHAIQDEPVALLIPLGSQGTLQGVNWQVVGFQHRMGTAPGDDESFGWNEYLLFNQKRGFCFLVDSQEGWSLVKPTTGAPSLGGNGQSASYLGTGYQLKDAYRAQTTYVAGEFYWRVQRGQVTQNYDYVNGPNLLSLEQTPTEAVWSSGSMINSDLVAKTFKLEGQQAMFTRSDVAPFSADNSLGLRTIIITVVLLLVLVALLSRCSSSSSCDPSYENCASSSFFYGARSAGGSWGGYSGGGGHK